MARPQRSDAAGTTKPIHFIAPQSAVDAIDIAAVVREASDDGVARPLIDVSPFGTHGGWAQVTCSAEMALRLVNAWRGAVGSTTIDEGGEERLAMLRRAAMAAYRAYDDALGNPLASHRQ